MALALRPSLAATAFQELLGHIPLAPTDVAFFESHRTSIRATLAGADGFELGRLEPIGSFARQTAIHATSDADLLAVLARPSVSTAGRLQASSTVLAKIRNVLSARFWRTEVVRDGQAVVVDFGDGSHPVDVVPAIWESQTGLHNYPVFLIPDGAGGWMPTSPTSHNRFLRDADARAGGKLTYAAQIIKYWCATRSSLVPLSGFHIELLLASERVCEGARAYASIVRDAFALLSRRGCAAINDPIRISGRIPAASTEAKRTAALRSVRDAFAHADRAIVAEQRGYEVAALHQWDLAFNGRFTK